MTIKYTIGDHVIYTYDALQRHSDPTPAIVCDIDWTDQVLPYRIVYTDGHHQIMTWVSSEDIQLDRAYVTDTTNTAIDPKESQGSSKLGFSHIPITAMLLISPGTKNGADKYGKWNWLDLEDNSMSVTTYLDAIQRHLLLFRAGQDNASDSGIHHLDHISAGVSVVRDAMVFGKVKDDRIKLADKDIDTIERLVNNTK